VATGALRTLTDAANAHPTAFKWISIGLTSLLGMNLAISAGKLAFGNLLGPVAQLWGVWSKYRAAGSIALAFPRIARALNMVGGAAGLLRRGMSLAFGLMRGGAGIFARACSVRSGWLVVLPVCWGAVWCRPSGSCVEGRAFSRVALSVRLAWPDPPRCFWGAACHGASA
jgi:hypothetical protein